ncbi:hypothetical protein [Nocardia grenadensis]|uniref:hypothetical protein n=1 Tax=Nocardia grenadensis TaxID=931537 RepID=UPI003D746489
MTGWEAGVSGTEWEIFCSEVFAIAERYAIQTFSNPGTLLLSGGSASTEAEVRGANPPIMLVDMGDASVCIETGWCVRVIADYEIQFEDKPSRRPRRSKRSSSGAPKSMCSPMTTTGGWRSGGVFGARIC